MTSEPLQARIVEETYDRSLSALVHPGWRARLPWLVQGTTTRGDGARPFDLGLFAGATPMAAVRGHWDQLLVETGAEHVVLARQVHEAEVRLHRGAGRRIQVEDPCDGHATDQAGVLLAVTVADCVPVFLVAPASRTVAVVHAGWRGAAAGILERGLALLADDLNVPPAEVELHLGPSVCGLCYEVGPEVFVALGREAPGEPGPIDLRGVLASRAATAGVPWSNMTVSSHCTRCTQSNLFSHRDGDGERQVGYIGVRT